MGDATISDGKLDLNGTDTEATGWAVTDSDSGEYAGPPISDKTLMSWVTLESLDDAARAGSAITLDRVSGDGFDGIIFAERQFNRFMNGSSGFQRTEDFDPGFEETQTGEEFHLAITYEHTEAGLQITGYRNGQPIGQYVKGESQWETNDAEILFGIRHGSTAGGPGALDASIDEARVYSTALTGERIAEIFAVGPASGEDQDGDGLPDAWEQLHFGNLDETADGDTDGDALANSAELARGTLPNNPDSDEDGLSDGSETNSGVFVSAEDTGTDPLNADTDRDGLGDGIETNTGVFVSAEDTGTDPHNADTDGDGFSDLEELSSDPPSDPFDPKSPATEVSDYLLGRWTFDEGEEMVDLENNFPDLVLQGDAQIVNGMLDLNGSGTSATGWAITGSDNGTYEGPSIEDKTLMAWVTLEGLEDMATGGSVLTLDRVNSDGFDGIVFAERQSNRFMNGSSGFQRTEDFEPGFEETETGQLIHLAIIYEHTETGLLITGYRNCEMIGQYTKGASTWETGDAEVMFGIRHGTTEGGPGAVDALIDEARIYRRALSGDEIRAICEGIPQPVGHWSFEGGDPLADEAGNFPDLLLMGDAEIVEGELGFALDLNGSGTEATGWAVTDSDTGEYSGPPIESKTLSAWVRLQGLDDVATAGSVMTIDRISGDQFDGIIFAERQPNRWMNGSSGFQRTQDFDPGFEETSIGDLVNLTITYETLDNGSLVITGYRNFERIGEYETVSSTWEAGDAEIFFGKRHGSTADGPGAIDALIEAATVWNVALTEEQITDILPELYLPRLLDDADGDGLPDEWECEHFAGEGQACDLAFLESVLPDGDPDEDGLDNTGEWRARTDPTNPDTDNDGLLDGVETKTRIFVSLTDTGTDPLIRDSDGDGLLDGIENPLLDFDPDNPLEQPGTDPNLANTDGDRLGLLDSDEVNSDPPTDPTDRNSPPEPPVLLVGHWTFEPGEELIDQTGNFPDLLLQDSGAAVEVVVVDGRGMLDVNGEGSTATGWAVTDSDSGEYTGPEITDKTLLVWATLEGLDDVASAGSLMTIDTVGTDQFDGIVFAEREPNRWMNGSSNFSRTQDWNPGFEETDPGEPLMMVITYEHLEAGGIEVIGYRNGEEIGRHVSDTPSIWQAGDAEVLFGVRHGSTAGGPGGLDALIDEARLYADVLSAEQIQQLFLEGPGGAGERFHITGVARDAGGSLTLSWQSEPGQLFAIEESLTLADPWTVIGTGIPAAEAPALITSAMVMGESDSAQAFYRVLRIPPPPLFNEGFEGDAPGWSVGVIDGLEPTATAWEIGVPTGGPGGAFGGAQAAATDLDAHYTDGTGIFLRSPAIDLTGVSRPKLEFRYFLEAGAGEGGRINLLDGDGTFRETIAVFDGEFKSVGEWTQESIRLQPVDGEVIFEFEFLSEFDDADDNGAGWFIDDFTVDD